MEYMSQSWYLFNIPDVMNDRMRNNQQEQENPSLSVYLLQSLVGEDIPC